MFRGSSGRISVAGPESVSGVFTRPIAQPASQQQTRRRFPVGLAALAGLVAGSGLVGYETSRAPLIAAVMVGVIVALVAWAVAGVERFATVVVAALPWLVLLIDRTPTLTLTFTSAAAVLFLLWLNPPEASVGVLSLVAAAAFLTIVAAHAVDSTAGTQFQEAAKYSLFPGMALVVANPEGRRRLVRMRTTLLASGVAAMAVQAASILLHFGETNVYYGVGEQLGLTGESPHELALIGVIVAIACLIGVRDIRWRVLGAAVAATPALASGVRSAVVALAITLVVLAIQARFRPSVVLGIAAIVAAVSFTGAGAIITNRYQADQAKGEYSSFLTSGSGRGALWTTAFDQWRRSSPSRMTVGYGLRSTEAIELRNLGESVTAQSDPVTELVELGVLGLVAWLLVWLVLIRSGIEGLVLLPLAIYMVLSGSMEYLGALVYGIALAGALTPTEHLGLVTDLGNGQPGADLAGSGDDAPVVRGQQALTA